MKLKFYTKMEKIEEALQRFDTRQQYVEWLLVYAEEVYKRIKEGDTEWLRAAEDDLGVLVKDMKSNFVVADVQDDDYAAIQHIVAAIQKRLYT